jgi:hypothetical protein
MYRYFYLITLKWHLRTFTSEKTVTGQVDVAGFDEGTEAVYETVISDAMNKLELDATHDPVVLAIHVMPENPGTRAHRMNRESGRR